MDGWISHTSPNTQQDLINMQATSLCFPPPLALKGTNSFLPRQHLLTPQRIGVRQIVAVATPSAGEVSTVDYSSSFSVFPAEACETIGGEACSAEMGPEVKPVAAAANVLNLASSKEEIEREYVEYNEPKTVFPGEACDDLGGEFCEANYQQGVYVEARSK